MGIEGNKFLEMVEEVRKIDPNTADWLLAQPLGEESGRCNQLASCMIWAITPQKHDYWLRIAKQLPPAYSGL